MKDRPKRLQFSLLSLLLLATTVAVWFANWRIQDSIEQLQAELPALRNYARELVVDDPTRFAVVSPHQAWQDEFRWQVHVPPTDGEPTQLRLQLREVDSNKLGAHVDSSLLPSGRHEIELVHGRHEDGWRVAVLLDGNTVMQQSMPESWNLGRGSSGANNISRLVQDLEPPITLFRQRFMVPTGPNSASTPDGPCDGILLWIDVPQPEDLTEP